MGIVTLDIYAYITPKFTCKGTYEMRAKRATGAPLTSATHVIQHGAGDLIAVGLSLHGSREWRAGRAGPPRGRGGADRPFRTPPHAAPPPPTPTPSSAHPPPILKRHKTP